VYEEWQDASSWPLESQATVTSEVEETQKDEPPADDLDTPTPTTALFAADAEEGEGGVVKEGEIGTEGTDGVDVSLGEPARVAEEEAGKADNKATSAVPPALAGMVPSSNRISISYAGSTRRLVMDAEVIEKVKIWRGEGKIELVLLLQEEKSVEAPSSEGESTIAAGLEDEAAAGGGGDEVKPDIVEGDEPSNDAVKEPLGYRGILASLPFSPCARITTLHSLGGCVTILLPSRGSLLTDSHLFFLPSLLISVIRLLLSFLTWRDWVQNISCGSSPLSLPLTFIYA